MSNILEQAKEVHANGTVPDLDKFAKENSIDGYDESANKPKKLDAIDAWIKAHDVAPKPPVETEDKKNDLPATPKETEEVKNGPGPIDQKTDTAVSDNSEETKDPEPTEEEKAAAQKKAEGAELKKQEEEAQKLRDEENEKKQELVSLVKEMRGSLFLMAAICEKHPWIKEVGQDDIFLCRAWLGKVLAGLDEPTPYKEDESEIKDATQIPPTADVMSETDVLIAQRDFNLVDKIEAVTSQRSLLESIASEISNMSFENATRDLNIARTNAYTYACNAKFRLGEQLASFRK